MSFAIFNAAGLVALVSVVFAAELPDGLVQTEGEVELPNGRKEFVSKTADVDCRFLQDTVTEEDGSSSFIFKDFQTGKSILVMSSMPDVCYVRDIPAKERARHIAECHGGVVLVNMEEGGPGPARTYVQGGELSPDDLSPELADACADRKLQEMTLVVSAPGKNKVSKRCVETIESVCQNVLCCCQRKCTKYGWLFRKNKCKRWEDKCETTEKCVNVIKKVGCD